MVVTEWQLDLDVGADPSSAHVEPEAAGGEGVPFRPVPLSRRGRAGSADDERDEGLAAFGVDAANDGVGGP
jgi:hypothetical protein